VDRPPGALRHGSTPCSPTPSCCWPALASILAPLCFLSFIASPLSYVFFIAGKQKMELGWQVALFTMTVAAFSAPLPLRQSVLGYAIGRSACCTWCTWLMSWHCAPLGNRRHHPRLYRSSRLESGRARRVAR
jgi:hypothetical protein